MGPVIDINKQKLRSLIENVCGEISTRNKRMANNTDQLPKIRVKQFWAPHRSYRLHTGHIHRKSNTLKSKSS